ncbi:hypothetical protein Hanom_Chr03g00275481 [Helianthus anomalus]
MELEAGSKLTKKPKHQGVKWLFLKVWRKTVKVTKPQEAKRKFTQQTIWMELEAGSKLAKKTKHQGVKWLFLKVWSKTVKVTKPQGVKRKFTL